MYTFKALHAVTPTYLAELISPYVLRRALRSTDKLLLEQPTQAFFVCVPYLWNSLPFKIIFKAKLKTYLFRQAYFRLFGFFRFLGLVDFLTFLTLSFFILLYL